MPQLYGSYSDGGHVALDAANHYFSFNGNGNGNANKAKFLMDNDTAFSGWILDSDNGDSMWTDSTAHIVYNQFKSNSGVSMSNQTIGAEDFSGTNSLDGEVAEIMVFDGALQNADRNTVMDYLKG